jgi:hypothetical protein
MKPFDLLFTIDGGLAYIFVPNRANPIKGLELLRAALHEWTKGGVGGGLCLSCARPGLEAVLTNPDSRVFYYVVDPYEGQEIDDRLRADVLARLARVPAHPVQLH